MANSSKLSATSYLLTIGEMAIDIAVSLLLLLMVGRAYGPSGLGVYTFLLSVFVIVSFLCEFGVNKWVEKELAADSHLDEHTLLAEAKAATLAAGVVAAACTAILGSWAAGAETVAQGMWSGFVLLIVAVPLSIYSGHLTSVLHGRGLHQDVSRASFIKRSIQVVLVYFLSSAGLRPELLMSVFILSEMTFILAARKKAAVPSLLAALGKLGHVAAVFRRSLKHYFTQEGLRVLFFVDFFALGFFVSASQEGAYAEASVLARLFLLIPLGAAPLYRAKVYEAAEPGGDDVYSSSRRTAARLFTIHAIAALLFLLYFPQILRAVFYIQGDVPQFFKAFSMLLPGLLFFIPTVVTEPLFIRDGKEDELNRLAANVFVLNAILNFYLIPFAGVFGAAAATSISLVIYFVLFSRKLGRERILSVRVYLLEGGLIYCGYHVVAAVRLPAVVIIPGVAVVMPILFWMTGLYGEQESGARSQPFDSAQGPEPVEGESGENVIPFPGEEKE